VPAKGGKERTTPLHLEAVERLAAWLAVPGIKDDPAGPLFPAARSPRGQGRDGFRPEPMTTRAVEKGDYLRLSDLDAVGRAPPRMVHPPVPPPTATTNPPQPARIGHSAPDTRPSSPRLAGTRHFDPGQNPPPDPLGRATRPQIALIRYEELIRSYLLKNDGYRNQRDITNYADHVVTRSVAADKTKEHRQQA
jgi:hypothetical protein